MPCSRCHLSGHNARNSLCPALYHSLTSLPSLRSPENFDNGVSGISPENVVSPSTIPLSPHFEARNSELTIDIPSSPPRTPPLTLTPMPRPVAIQPREYVSRRRRPSYALLAFVGSFENLRPSIEVVMRGLLYKGYILPRNLMRAAPINRGIMRYFIHASTRNVQTCPVNRNHIVGLAVLPDEGGVRLLSNEPYPENQEVFLLVPQLPGLTITDDEFDGWVSPRTTPPNVVSNVPRRRIASSYVKEWGIVVDLDASVFVAEQPPAMCFICLEEKPATTIAKTNCHHEYCVDCMKAHIDSKKHTTEKIQCPMCRTPLSEISLCDIRVHTDLQEFIRNLL